MEGGVGRWM
uniref:Uncharacterized protein n=1 Tax=Arundo donax TaxID=35708 RepID=A0A0A8ZWX7_ARUDO